MRVTIDAGTNERRGEIIAAATRLLVRMPQDKIAIRDLERESGITRGGIYYYFTSKEEIFSEVVRDGLTLLRDDLALACSGDDSATEKMRRVMLMLRRQYDEYRSMFDVLIRFFFGAEPTVRIDDRLQQAVTSIMADCVTTVTDVIEQGRADGEFWCDDPNFEAMAIWGLAVTVVQMQTPNKRLAVVARETEQLNRDLVEYVLRSLRNGAPPV